MVRTCAYDHVFAPSLRRDGSDARRFVTSGCSDDEEAGAAASHRTGHYRAVARWGSEVIERLRFRRPSVGAVACVVDPYQVRTRDGDRVYRRPLTGPFVWFWADVDDQGLRMVPLAPWRRPTEIAIPWGDVDQVDLDGDRVTFETATFEPITLWGSDKLTEATRKAPPGFVTHERPRGRPHRTILVPVGYEPDWRTQSEKRGEPEWTRTRASRRRSDDR